MQPNPLILTIDIGTTSTRAMLFDAQARAVPGCTVQVANRLETTADGGATFDPVTLLENVAAVVDRLLNQAGDRAGEIGAVAMDTFVSNVLGVDGDGQPVTPVYTYADTRNAEDAQALRAELGPDGVAAAHDRTGCLVHTSYLPARFRWLARTRPHELAQVKRWISVGEYVLAQFTGELGASVSVAAWTGLLDRRDLVWDGVWLEALGMTADQLAPLTDVDRPWSGLVAPWAARWPALASGPWFPAVGDGAAANIGSGCHAPNRVALTVGTTGAMRVVLDPAVDQVPPGLWLYRVDTGRALLGGATTEGGNLFAWLQKTLRLPGDAALEQTLQERAPAGHGLTVLPFIGGERAPGWNESARAHFAGIGLHTDAVDLVQASLEAMAYRFGLIYARIAAHLPPDAGRRVIASGGGLLRSPAWLQIMADVLNHPVEALAEGELTSRGIALLALEQLGVATQPSALPPQRDRVYAPDPARHAIHQQAMARQVALYGRVL